MNDMKMNESLVFDACALVEEIVMMTDIKAMQTKARQAAFLLNKVMEEGEKVEENNSGLDRTDP